MLIRLAMRGTLGALCSIQIIASVRSRSSTPAPKSPAGACATSGVRSRATGREIDAPVYELYGLTEEDIGIVEGT